MSLSQCEFLFKISRLDGSENPPASAGDPGLDPRVGKLQREKGTATHSIALAWESHGQEEPGGLQALGSHRVGHA